MRDRRLTTAAVAAIAAVTLSLGGQAQVRPPSQGLGVLQEPLGNAGEAIFPAFEGWGPLKEGSPQVLLLGYFNRNRTQSLDIPIGPENRIEPGGPDFGQPTHFEPGRQYGVFAIQIPKDLGTKRLTWTITANGTTSTVSFWVNPQYWIDFYKNLANGNEPPVIKFTPESPGLTGPPRERFYRTLSGAVGQPVTLTIWAADQPPTTSSPEPGAAEPPRGGRNIQKPAPDTEPPPAIIGGRVISGATPAPGGGGAAARAERRGDIQVLWKKYRGPGEVKIGEETIALTNGGDAKKFLEATTTATFSAPGEYWLRAQINDSSGNGGGGDQCCWTSAHIVVNIK